MKKFFGIAALFAALGLAAFFSACSNDSDGGYVLPPAAPAPGPTPTPAPAPTPTYTVTFNSNGGTEVTSQTVTSGQTASKPADPTKDHFNFAGWCSDAECQTPFDFATPIVGDTNLYAKWSNLPVYIVTFDLNGGKYGSSDTYTQNIEDGSKAMRPASDPTKDDYVSGDVTTKYAFENWYADSGCGTLFDFDATTITGPTTVYAKWNETKYYTVTFDLNGGKYGSSGAYTQSVLNDSKVTRPASDPTKDDNVGADVTTKYVFDNWYADSGCGTLFDFNTMTISGPTTVYAKWNEIKCYAVKIANDIEHGSVSSDATERVAAGTVVMLTASPSSGYGLDFYTVTDADSNPVTVTDGKFEMPSRDVYVTAAFKAINSVPLTLEAIKAETKVTFINKSSGTVTYRVNGGEVQSIGNGTTKEITLSNVGDKVCFYGDTADYSRIIKPFGSLKEYYYSNIDCDKYCYVYGNIMSLVDSMHYENATDSRQCYFGKLFYNNVCIKNKQGIDLFLPATKLTEFCYYSMFYGCKSLTSAPALPATTLADSCYRDMFYGCTNLTSAPALPATTLADDCYREMFYGCTNLTSAPALPATTLADGCYHSMFYYTNLTSAPALPATTLADDCYHSMFYYTNLTSAPALPATTLADDCYSSMFEGCKSLTSAPALPATALARFCYSRMFRDCTSLTSAPALPATVLAFCCYFHMFYGCKSLTSAPALPATTLADCCYEDMFRGCTSLASAPALPATTLANGCYSSMFYDCTSLTSAPALPATTLARSCYTRMFYGCTNQTSAPALPATTLADSCYEEMFYCCTSLTSAPALPATTLADSCYASMFYGCTKLTKAPFLPAMKTSVDSYNKMFKNCKSLSSVTCLLVTAGYIEDWLYGTSSSGTFTKAAEADWRSGEKGIPKGWTVVDYQE